MPINATGYAHVRLTVTDIDVSRPFYDKVFGFPVAVEVPADADQETRDQLWWVFGGVIYSVGSSLLGLRPVGSDTFADDRTGLDHVCFTVGSHDDLEDAVRTLDELGVAHEAIKDIGQGWILEFRDPDNIALELMAPKA